MEHFSVHLYEKRPEYKRTRMVQLASYLVADSVESYRSDYIDGENVEAVFDPPELEEGLAFRQSIPADLMSLLQKWAQGFVPLNGIERALSNLIDTRASHPVERIAGVMTPDAALALLEPGDTLIDCTGSRSLLRDHLVPGSGTATEGANTVNIRLEYAIVVTFLYGQAYDCNEFCKYYKNEGNSQYKFIPAVARTCEVADRHDAEVIIDRPSPAGACLPALERAEVRVNLIPVTEASRACGLFHDAVMAGHVSHRGDPRLTDAVLGATKRRISDGWVWNRRLGVDITPLNAATLAHWAAVNLPEPADPRIY